MGDKHGLASYLLIFHSWNYPVSACVMSRPLQRRYGSVAVPIVYVYGKYSLGRLNCSDCMWKSGLVSFLTECIGCTNIGGSLQLAYNDPSSSEAKFRIGSASIKTTRQQLASRVYRLFVQITFYLIN